MSARFLSATMLLDFDGREVPVDDNSGVQFGLLLAQNLLGRRLTFGANVFLPDDHVIRFQMLPRKQPQYIMVTNDNHVLVADVGGGIAQLREVRLMILGKTLAQAGLLGIKVRFHYADPDAELEVEDERLLRSTTEPVTWRFPQRDPEAKEWSYQLTLIAMDGTSTVLDPVRSTGLIAVHPLT